MLSSGRAKFKRPFKNVLGEGQGVRRNSSLLCCNGHITGLVNALRRLPHAIFAALYAARPGSFFTLSEIIFVSCITC